MNSKPDQSFDSILNKFSKNIYGSTKGRLRHELLVYHMAKHISLADSAKVIDIGAGTGVMTLEYLQQGHDVTFNDLSGEAIAQARKVFASQQRVQFIQGGLQAIMQRQSFDLVICHAVLEWLNSPYDAIERLVNLVKPGGYLSLSFFNKDAHRFGNILYGNFDYVDDDLKTKKTVRLNPNNALEPTSVLSSLAQHEAIVVHSAGIRCFHDYLKDPAMREGMFDKIKDMEIKFGSTEPYKWLGKYFHIIVKIDPQAKAE